MEGVFQPVFFFFAGSFLMRVFFEGSGFLGHGQRKTSGFFGGFFLTQTSSNFF